ITIKNEFRRLYGPKVKTFEERLAEEKRKRKVYGCQISCLDDMLMPSDVLNNLSFWEICGPTGVGKTQLLLTLVLNFVANQISPALYIDTKLDFSARRIKQMLKARKIERELHAGIMSYIKVERVLSAIGVVEMLEQFLEQLQQENEDVMAIKLIVIDSLPAVWFLLKADSDRLAGKWLLSRLSQAINRLVFEHYIAVICRNETKTTTKVFQLPHNEDHDVSDLIEADDMVRITNRHLLLFKHRPVLGYFWLTKPHLRLSRNMLSRDGNHHQDNATLLYVLFEYLKVVSHQKMFSVLLG
ncbi:hypothetical protein DOY81_012344, partial [Sarcophaga bullata]